MPPRDRQQQPPGVLVPRVREHGVGRPGLDDLAGAHHRDPVGDALDDGEVVADQQHGGAAGPQRVEQLEDLRLDGHVEGGGRLVGDEQRRRQRDRRGDEGALAQPAGELAGALPGGECRIRDAGVGEQLEHPGTPGARSELGVQPQRVVDLPPDGAQRVEGDQRVLQDEADLLAPDAAPPCRGNRQQRLAAEGDFVGVHLRRRRRSGRSGCAR